MKAAKTLKAMVSNLLLELGAPAPHFSPFGAGACFSLPDPVSSVPLQAWAGFCSSAPFYEWEGEPGASILSLPSVQSANATLQVLSAEFARVGAPRPDRILPASVGEALVAFKAQPPNHVSRSLRIPLERVLTSALVARMSVSERARFHSQSAAEAKHWIESLGDFMSMPESLFSLALGLHLGQVPRGLQIPPVCVCNTALDPRDCFDHFLVCRKLKRGQILRHDCVVRELARCATEAGADVQVEPRRVLDYEESRVDIIATWFDSTDLIDVRVSHPCARTYVERAAREPGYTARLGEAAKRGIRAYQQMARDLGGQFSPFVLEAHGRFGASAWRVVCAMAARAADLSPFPREDERFFRYDFTRRLSLALQRGNGLLLQQALLRARAMVAVHVTHRREA